MFFDVLQKQERLLKQMVVLDDDCVELVVQLRKIATVVFQLHFAVLEHSKFSRMLPEFETETVATPLDFVQQVTCYLTGNRV